MTTILFVCGKNCRRSTTAEEIFAGMGGIEVSSAGTSPEAEYPVSADLLEQRQRRYLRVRFSAVLKDKKIACLGVPDVCSYMQPELVTLLRTKVIPWLLRS